ncbi:MAG: MaoC family dehydratase [Dehalococcoidia bacterium]|nr:MaoC family dehydratase [Dehalococcoidia bacterium]
MADAVHGIEVGAKAVFTKTITNEDIRKFADASGDDQPLHLNAAHAARTRFKEPIAHGILSASVISAAIGTRLAPDKVVIYLSQNLRFRAPVKPGDTITATITATGLDLERSRVNLDTVVTNQDGAEVVTGDALVMVEPLS